MLRHSHSHHRNCSFEELFKVIQEGRYRRFGVKKNYLKDIIEGLIDSGTVRGWMGKGVCSDVAPSLEYDYRERLFIVLIDKMQNLSLIGLPLNLFQRILTIIHWGLSYSSPITISLAC
jgi:hypothetical protein